LDNWTGGKAKDGKGEDAGDNGDPKTPATGRSKKTGATPSTAGTGAGVKKRASTSKRTNTTTPGSRSRKVKSQALVKAEDEEQDDVEDDDMMGVDTPTKKGGASQVKAEFGKNGGNPANQFMPNDFTNFPAILPELVLERQAILVNLNGSWTLSPVTIDIHTQWLARLPAHIQSQFYTQATACSARKANNISNSFVIDDDEGEATAQILGEFNVAALKMPQLPSLPGRMDAGLDYFAPANNGNNTAAARAGQVDLNSIPMHPSYMDEVERETRDQEARDRDTLFGGCGGI
jgi:hypothetical protein